MHVQVFVLVRVGGGLQKFQFVDIDLSLLNGRHTKELIIVLGTLVVALFVRYEQVIKDRLRLIAGMK